MGVWMIATDRIKIVPEPDEELIAEYREFSKKHYPQRYGDEPFPNPWFFDKDNVLICHAGKFAEPSMWYPFLRERFFQPRGILVPDEIDIAGECDEGFWDLAEERYPEYKIWRERFA